MLVIVFIVLAGIGMSENVRHGEVMKNENSAFLTFLSGIFACIAMVGTVMTVYGEEGHATMAIVGILGSVVCNFKPIKVGLDYQAKLPYAKDMSLIDKFKVGPVWAWLRFTMVGIGKCGKAVLYATLIGIPLYKGVEGHQQHLDAYAEQRELEEEKKALDELEMRNNVKRKMEQEKRADNGKRRN